MVKVTECKTIAMNLQAVKEKKGDTFYKLKDDLKSMAEVDLTNTNGELRSTFDLIVDLGLFVADEHSKAILNKHNLF